jgi:REP element-mobilizing transposase RayT
MCSSSLSAFLSYRLHESNRQQNHVHLWIRQRQSVTIPFRGSLLLLVHVRVLYGVVADLRNRMTGRQSFIWDLTQYCSHTVPLYRST